LALSLGMPAAHARLLPPTRPQPRVTRSPPDAFSPPRRACLRRHEPPHRAEFRLASDAPPCLPGSPCHRPSPRTALEYRHRGPRPHQFRARRRRPPSTDDCFVTMNAESAGELCFFWHKNDGSHASVSLFHHAARRSPGDGIMRSSDFFRHLVMIKRPLIITPGLELIWSERIISTARTLARRICDQQGMVWRNDLVYRRNAEDLNWCSTEFRLVRH
jgi:hypothetical protein